LQLCRELTERPRPPHGAVIRADARRCASELLGHDAHAGNGFHEGTEVETVGGKGLRARFQLVQSRSHADA